MCPSQQPTVCSYFRDIYCLCNTFTQTMTCVYQKASTNFLKRAFSRFPKRSCVEENDAFSFLLIFDKQYFNMIGIDISSPLLILKII